MMRKRSRKVSATRRSVLDLMKRLFVVVHGSYLVLETPPNRSRSLCTVLRLREQMLKAAVVLELCPRALARKKAFGPDRTCTRCDEWMWGPPPCPACGWDPGMTLQTPKGNYKLTASGLTRAPAKD